MARERRVDHRSHETPGKGIPYVESNDEVWDFPEHSKALADRVDELFETNAGPKGDSAYQVWLDEGNTGSEQDFLESLRGPEGPDGPSAYDVWLGEGNTGTEQDFLDSLQGPPGNADTDQLEIDVEALQQEVAVLLDRINELEARLDVRENLDTWGSLELARPNP